MRGDSLELMIVISLYYLMRGDSLELMRGDYMLYRQSKGIMCNHIQCQLLASEPMQFNFQKGVDMVLLFI
jgi:hypothetical protein